jgi:hypothetical protein
VALLDTSNSWLRLLLLQKLLLCAGSPASLWAEPAWSHQQHI